MQLYRTTKQVILAAEKMIRKNNVLLLVLLVLIIPQRSYAVPVFGKIFELRQPGGTTVKVKIWGDEFYQTVETLDGYTLIRDPKNQRICYAGLSQDKSDYISTGIPANLPLPARRNIERHIRIKPAALKAKVKAARARFAAQDLTAASMTSSEVLSSPPCTGTVQGICLIVDFPDEPGTISSAQVDDYCNLPGYTGYGNNGSIRDFFYDVSDGALTYTNYVPLSYYTAQNNKSYYDDPSEESGPKARELIIEALTWLDNNGFDFSNYDSNGDGLIDGINCYYAGTVSSGWSMGLWPHSWTVSFSADGVSTYKYQITDMGSTLEIGTFSHENGHMLCYWPDLYDYDYDSSGVGNYCLMASGSHAGGGSNPNEPCAYLKYDAGWASVTELTGPQVGLSVTAAVNSFYKYSHPVLSNEYYLIENRQKTDRDSELPDAGVAIWHIDTNGSNNDQQMTPEQHYLVTLVQADGDWDLENNRNSGDTTDLFDASSYDECTPLTNPNTNWWAGNSSMLSVYSISAVGSTMSFSYDQLELPPQVYDDSVEVEKNSSATITLQAIDDGMPDPPGDLTYIITSSPGNGTLTDPAAGVISTFPYTLLNNGNELTYTPENDFLGFDSFQFKANDGGTAPEGGDSDPAAISISVSLTHLLLQEDFEAAFVSGAPPGWSKSYKTDSVDWIRNIGAFNGGIAHGGTYNAMLFYEDWGDRETYLITPELNFDDYPVNPTLEFWHKQEDWIGDQDTLTVYYKTSPGGSWVYLAGYLTELADWTKHTIGLPNLSGSYYIAFLGNARYGYGVCIDDVKVTAEPIENQPPTVVGESIDVVSSSSRDIYFQAADDSLPDPPGQLSYIVTSLPLHGELDDPGNGSINSVPYTLVNYSSSVIYSPDPGYSGPDSFSFMANDSEYDSNTGTISINVFHAIYFADMDTDPGWSLDPGSGDSKWEWGTPAGGGGENGNPDPTSGYTGFNVMGYNLLGDYRNNIPATEWATTQAIDCSAYTNIDLTFYRWLNVEEPPYDYAYIEVSNDGSNWTKIWQNLSEITDSGWSQQQFDISAVADTQATVFLRWGMGRTDSSWPFSGWNIDDVLLTGTYLGPRSDINDDGKVNGEDFAILASRWLDNGCESPDFCEGADINANGNVGTDDLLEIVLDWTLNY